MVSEDGKKKIAPLASVEKRLKNAGALLLFGTVFASVIQIFSARNVRSITLLKGGKDALVHTFSVLPFWKKQVVGVGLLYGKNAYVPPSQSPSLFPSLSLCPHPPQCSPTEFLATKSIGYYILHVRNRRLPYLLDYEATFPRPSLFNSLFYRSVSPPSSPSIFSPSPFPSAS